MVRIAALLCLLLPPGLLGGCALVDQRTFDAQAGVLRKEPGPPGEAALVPLVTIDVSKPNPSYGAALQGAVRGAVDRKPDVEFEVVSVVPATGTTAEQAAAAAGITGDAREIARAINADGVDDGRIHLSARSDPGVSARQVQVFVR